MALPLGRSAGPVAGVCAPSAEPRPALRTVDAVALIVGTVVGAGIFRLPSLVAANTGTEWTMMLAWVLGGVVSLVGALCYAELASTYPHAGGDYHFLGRAFGRKLAFLFAWARISVIQTGSIAVLSYVLGDYAAGLVSLGPFSSPLYAALCVVLLTALNVAGVQAGKTAQNLLTAFEVLGLVLVVSAGLFVAPSTPAVTAASSPTAFGLAMVFVLFTYGGWNEAAYISAEVHGRRGILRALVWSLALVTVLYVLVNWAYLRGLGLAGVAGSSAVAADLMDRAFGAGGSRLVGIIVVVSTLTSVNATIFTGARSAYALGRDFRVFSLLGRWQAGPGPVNALLVQGVAALALVLLGAATRKGVVTMVEYTAPVFWLFFLLTGASLFVLRARDPRAPRPFRVPLYPLTPLLFCATCAYLLYNSLSYYGVGALVGVGVLAVGAVVLVLSRGRESQGGS
ncbi:MAG: APC family permease [Candidatus Rokuibacteriota bacterium]